MHVMDYLGKMPIEYLFYGDVTNQLFNKILEFHLAAGFDPFALPINYECESNLTLD